MVETIQAKPLAGTGTASGPILILSEPISFWGGVSQETGKIINHHHPQCGVDISGTVLCLPGTIGSSSGSSIMLELIHNNAAPAAILIDHPDAILLLGIIVAQEMGWTAPPAVQLPKDLFTRLEGHTISVDAGGTIRFG